MPKLSALFVRLSLLYLWLGITFGTLLLINKGMPFAPWLWKLLPAHIEVLLLGWLVQLAMGIAFWILPRFFRGKPRGDERWSLAGLILLNLGILLVVAQDLFTLLGITWIGRSLEIFGGSAYLFGNWKRVKPSGT